MITTYPPKNIAFEKVLELLSVDSSIVDESKILTSHPHHYRSDLVSPLTLYHVIMTFDTHVENCLHVTLWENEKILVTRGFNDDVRCPDEKPFGKIVGKGENGGN